MYVQRAGMVGGWQSEKRWSEMMASFAREQDHGGCKASGDLQTED